MIGEQSVHGTVSRGDSVIATARNVQEARHLEQPGVSQLRFDHTDSQQTINETMSKTIGIHGNFDVLVNNAGCIAIGNWEDLEQVRWASGKALCLGGSGLNFCRRAI